MHLVLAEYTEARERKYNNGSRMSFSSFRCIASQIEVGGKVALPFPSPLRESVVKPGGLCVLWKASSLVSYEQGELGLLFQ